VSIASEQDLGLTQSEAVERFHRFGPNEIPRPASRPLIRFALKLWGPVPWMLEASIILELLRRRPLESGIIAGLLIFNAFLSFLQENRAQSAVELLRRKLQVAARVLRDGQWQSISAKLIVPGDTVYIRMGDFVPADAKISRGNLTVDQSTLTGESIPVERTAGEFVYSGSIVARGEAMGTVTATGMSTRFGKTAELVHEAREPRQMDAVVSSVVRYLVFFDVALVAALFAWAAAKGLPLASMFPFVLILLVTAVPVALPAAFAVTTALAALDLANRGVLVTRLSAIDQAATMDELCTDKTGTLTENRLRVCDVVAYPPHEGADVLALAAYACDPGTRDPFDIAILNVAPTAHPLGPRVDFQPFDPATKQSLARVRGPQGIVTVVKGAPTMKQLSSPERNIDADITRLASSGARVLAVAVGPGDELQIAGLIAFSDTLRPDAVSVVHNLRERGISVRMVTGDMETTARTVANELDIHELDAGIYPEDKLRIIEALQRQGHIVGMTGDGVNDAPSLRQADVGVAVASATDIAKSAAGMVLTEPGLGGTVSAIDTGRAVFQRLLTWTLNKMVKALHAALVLSSGFFFLGGVMLLTPRLMVLMLFANDFVTLSLAKDRVRISRGPNRWEIPMLLAGALPLALAWTMFTLAVYLIGKFDWALDLPRLQTLTFLTMIYTGQATIYMVRERDRFYNSRPSRWLLFTTLADIAVVSVLAVYGIAMASLPLSVVLTVLAAVVASFVPLDLLKVVIFRRLFSPAGTPASIAKNSL
jgi:H+-transporting ATPase